MRANSSAFLPLGEPIAVTNLPSMTRRPWRVGARFPGLAETLRKSPRDFACLLARGTPSGPIAPGATGSPSVLAEQAVLKAPTLVIFSGRLSFLPRRHRLPSNA